MIPATSETKAHTTGKKATGYKLLRTSNHKDTNVIYRY